MREAILKCLEDFAENSKPTWIIKYNGNCISVGKKSGWISISAAKNALRHWLPGFTDWRKRLEIIQELEEQKIITYETI